MNCLILLFCLSLTTCFAQTDNPSGWSGLKPVNITRLTTVANIYASGYDAATSVVVFSSTSGIEKWSFTANTLLNYTSLGKGSTPVRNGVWIDTSRSWSPSAKAIICYTDTAGSIFEYDIASASAINVFNAPATIQACVVDFKNYVTWIAYSNKITRILMTSPGGTWTVTQTSAAYTGTITSAGIDTSNGYAYFGTNGAALIRVPLNYTQNFNNSKPFTYISNIGAGSIVSFHMDYVNQWMFLGTSVGIALRYNLGDFTSNYAFSVLGSNQYISSIVHNPSVNTTFFATEGGNVYRTNNDPFNAVFDSVYVNCSLFGCGSGVIPMTNMVSDGKTAIIGARGSVSRVIKMQLYDCGVHSSCSECLEDVYCGWCASNQACTVSSDCSMNFLTSSDLCPALYNLSPSSGASLGNTKVYISGSLFVNDGNTSCQFDSDYVPAVYINSSTIMCQSPAHAQGEVGVQVYYKGVLYVGDVLNYTYYDCDGDSCGSCYSEDKPDCKWCIEESICGISSTCTIADDISQNTCPSLLELYPSSGPVEGGSVIFISGTYFANIGYSCLFGSQEVPANKINSTFISCTTPISILDKNNYVNVTVTYNGTSTLYSPTTLSFFYYKCSGSTCGECLEGYCTWCLNSNQCYNQNVNITCNYPLGVSASCPVLYTIEPPSVYYEENTTLYIIGSNFIEDNVDYQCRFYDNTIDVLTSATWINSTTLSCDSIVNTVSQLSVEILYNGVQYTSSPASLSIYDCASSSCGECLGDLKPVCEWCLQSQQCVTNNDTCSVGSSINQCPSLLSINPSSGFIYGGTTVYVFSNYLVPSTSSENYTCSFGGNFVAGVQLNSTTIRCTSPPGFHGNTTVALYYNNILYSPQSLPYFYYGCEDISDCSSCFAIPYCSWCLPYSCVETNVSSCPISFQTSSCPSITDINPDHYAVGSPIDVTVTGTRFIDAGTYACLFNGVMYPASWSSYTTVICHMNSTNGYIPGNITLYYNGQVYVNNSKYFEFFDCNMGNSQSSCSSCFANPSQYCSWCLNTFSCGQIDSCNSSFWLNSSCPEINSLNPDYASTEGNTTIKINGTMFYPQFNFTCHFGTSQVPADIISDTEIQCSSPSYSPSKRDTLATLAFYLSAGGKPYTNNYSFDIIDCNPTQDLYCSDCTQQGDARCNWCTYSSSCSLDYQCEILSAGLPSECPSILSIFPSMGPQEGGTEIFITGANLVNSSSLSCTFNSGTLVQQVPGRYLNVTTISCVTPASSISGNSFVNVQVNSKSISRDSLTFTFTNIAAIQSKSKSLLSTAGIIGIIIALAAVLFILAAILVLFFKRNRNQLQKKKLKEPDYALIAFGSAFPSYSVRKSKTEGFDRLEMLLLHYDYLLPTAICEITSTQDIDQVAKAITFLFETHRRTGDLLKHLITIEVRNAENESSLFRPTSPVSKIIGNYNKIVGLKYLWQALALPIHELNDLGASENGASTGLYDTQGRTIGTSIMTTSSLEVDPQRVDDITEVSVNQYQLMLIVQKIFNGIIKSVEFVPNELRVLYAHIKEEVNRKYPDQVYKSLASFLFGRYICPAILAPHVHGLLEEPPNHNCQRYLILVSKILQHLALGTLPDKSDDFTQKLVEFVTTNEEPLYDYLDELVTGVEDNRVYDGEVSVPEQYKQNALYCLHYHIAANEVLVKRHCENNSKGRELAVELVATLSELGTPTPPKPS